MPNFSVTQVKARLSELLTRAEADEEIVITRRGDAVVRLVPMKNKRKPADWARIDSLRNSMPAMETNSVDIVRYVREDRCFDRIRTI